MSHDANAHVIVQEDVFTPDGRTLLLKAGQRISSDLLHKLLKFGSPVSNFDFASEMLEGSAQGQTPVPLRGREGLGDPTVLVYEPNHNHHKRLVECLKLCGLKPNRLTTIHTPAMADYALNKYDPEVMIVDAGIFGSMPTVADIEKLTRCCKKLIVLTEFNNLPDTRQNIFARGWQRLADATGVHLIEKPINRQQLRSLLASA